MKMARLFLLALATTACGHPDLSLKGPSQAIADTCLDYTLIGEGGESVSNLVKDLVETSDYGLRLRDRPTATTGAGTADVAPAGLAVRGFFAGAGCNASKLLNGKLLTIPAKVLKDSTPTVAFSFRAGAGSRTLVATVVEASTGGAVWIHGDVVRAKVDLTLSASLPLPAKVTPQPLANLTPPPSVAAPGSFAGMALQSVVPSGGGFAYATISAPTAAQGFYAASQMQALAP